MKRLLLHVGLLVLSAGAVCAQPIEGQSREFGVKFRAIGGSDWCKSSLEVRLDAAKSSAYRPDTVPFVQMLGRIRAVAQSECTATREIAYRGRTKGKPVFAAEMSSLTGWRLIRLDPVSQTPLCAQQVSLTVCKSQIDAYRLAKRLFAKSPFERVEITSALLPDSEHLSWRVDSVYGRLKLVRLNELPAQIKNARELAETLTSAIAETCSKDRGTPQIIANYSPSERIAATRTACAKDGQLAEITAVIVAWSHGTYRVFSLRADGSDLTRFAALAAALTKASVEPL